jgi:hypothetical protein
LRGVTNIIVNILTEKNLTVKESLTILERAKITLEESVQSTKWGESINRAEDLIGSTLFYSKKDVIAEIERRKAVRDSQDALDSASNTDTGSRQTTPAEQNPTADKSEPYYGCNLIEALQEDIYQHVCDKIEMLFTPDEATQAETVRSYMRDKLAEVFSTRELRPRMVESNFYTEWNAYDFYIGQPADVDFWISHKECGREFTPKYMSKRFQIYLSTDGKYKLQETLCRPPGMCLPPTPHECVYENRIIAEGSRRRVFAAFEVWTGRSPRLIEEPRCYEWKEWDWGDF